MANFSGTLLVAAAMAMGAGACAMDGEQFDVGTSQAEVKGVDLGIPKAIEFDAATLVDSVLVDVKKRWTRKGKFFMDIEITGLNGGFAFHGNQLVRVKDTTIFSENADVASVIVDWNTDTIPRHVNEIYTVCVQVLKRKRRKNGTFKFKPKGPEKCRDFGPF